MSASKIEWTDRSDWNPIRGCTRVSEGCGSDRGGGCYAEAIAARFSGPGMPFHGFATRTAKGGRWTGKVALIEDRLLLPLRWKKPARVFVSSTSDLFHEALRDADIDRVFAVMALCPHLTFQVLTKRSARMREYCTSRFTTEAGSDALCEAIECIDEFRHDAGGEWDAPLPNLWLGVSVEDQTRADERREDFASTPAAVKFVSYEPALGAVDWTGWDFVDQIIGGGESGPKARPAHPDWFRETRDFCADNSMAYFHKQWGEWVNAPEIIDAGGPSFHQFDDGVWVRRVGKKRAGRLLDGELWSEFPA